MPCSPATAATETPGVRQVAKSVALNSGEYLRWVRRVEYLWLSEVLSIVSTIKFVETILQDLAANLNMTLLDAYYSVAGNATQKFGMLKFEFFGILGFESE